MRAYIPALDVLSLITRPVPAISQIMNTDREGVVDRWKMGSRERERERERDRGGEINQSSLIFVVEFSKCKRCY